MVFEINANWQLPNVPRHKKFFYSVKFILVLFLRGLYTFLAGFQ